MTILHRLRPLTIMFLMLSAAQTRSQSRELFFDRLSIREGLSQGTVFSILQDRQGFMWFGTADGLNKYDGYSFVHYVHDVNDSTSISDSRVIALLEDRSGRLWIGTIGGGLNLFDRETGTFRRFRADRNDSNSLSDDRVNSLFEDSRGTIWVGTTVAGINAFNPETGVFRRYIHDPLDSTTISSNHVFPILEDREGRLWVGTPEGVNLFDRTTGSFRRVRNDPEDSSSLSHSYVNALHCDRAGNVWVGTVNGLNRFAGFETRKSGGRSGTQAGRDNLRPRFIRYQNDPADPQSLEGMSVWAIYEDRSGSFWLGTDGGGLKRMNRQTGRYERFLSDVSNPGSLSDNSVRCIFQDVSGTLWIGTNVGGLNTCNPHRRKFTSHSVHQDSSLGVSSNWIRSLWEDRRGRLWIGSAGTSLDIFTPSTGLFSHIPMEGSVEALHESPSGNTMWVGSRTGLYQCDIDLLRFRRIEFSTPDPDTLASRRIRVLEFDGSGNLWFGILNRGVAVYRPEDRSMVQYQHDPADSGSLSDNLIRAIHLDQSGSIWFGTYGGLDRFDPQTERFVHYRHDPLNPASLSNDNILSIFDFPADSGMVLWVGTFGGGLNRVETRTGRVKRYTTREGLPNNVVYGILGDGRGQLWMSTNRGVACLDPATSEVKLFDISDGLQGNEFAVGAYHAGRSGLMYLGGVSGFSIFRPDSVFESTFIPPVVITAIRKLDEPIRAGASGVVLGPGDRYITIEFAALDYTNPWKNQYAYRLRGFDDNWTMAGTRRQASFTNLDVGEYLFEARGSNSDGVWNEHPVALRIIVTPPFWKTWWFTSIVAAGLLALGYVTYRRRRNADLEKARILGELQAARTAQLGLLPGADPILDGLDISGACIPAREVGGDFFEYLDVDPGRSHLTVAVGDVSGKGVNAAMTAVMVIGMLNREIEFSLSPAGMLRHINSTLYMKTDKRLFVAMLLASFEGAMRSMTFSNAGQLLPIRRRGGVLTSLTGKGARFPLGVLEDAAYEDCTVDLQPGDVVVFTSDGVTDARRADGTFLDDDGIRSVICELPDTLSAREMVQRIVAAVQEVTGERQLHDDVTIVVAKVG